MPWKEVLPMEERFSFVLAVKEERESFAQYGEGPPGDQVEPSPPPLPWEGRGDPKSSQQAAATPY